MEALTAIDVNTGKQVGTSSLNDTILKANLEAADEILRQLRLRDMGGIIVVDFIDMESADDRKKVLNHFTTGLERDRARTRVGRISSLGLVEITRKQIPLWSLFSHASLDSGERDDERTLQFDKGPIP